MNTPALEFENVTKRFSNDKIIVDDLSLCVKEGEFFSILGPSGCGKTTCLRMISGLEKPTAGTVRINGKVVNDVHPHKRNVHMVFQKYALFPHLNVFDNVAFGLRMKKESESKVKDQVNRMLRMVKLDDYAKRPIQQLSGGEQQRVALVRSLINEPAILLLDEPLGALDLKLREQMQLELATIQKQLGTTFIFVTHDQWEALTLSDRIAIMNNGKIEQVGTPNEVYENPKTAFVAKFVGTTNLFKGTVTNIVQTAITVQTDIGFQITTKPVEDRPLPNLGQKIGIVVRPEKIRLRSSAPSGSQSGTQSHQSGGGTGTSMIVETPVQSSLSTSLNSVRGLVLDRTYFGATTQIRVKIAEDQRPIVVVIANQTATKMPSLKVGERYYAVWESQDCVLVDDI